MPVHAPVATPTAPSAVAYRRTTCRLCASERLTQVWSFGTTPLANSYLKPTDIGRPEPVAPLDVFHCEQCHLAQLRDVVSPHLLFDHYLYVSSTSPSFRAHFADYARHLTERFALTADDLVVDIGSNDGILLQPLQETGVQVLGIDPAENVAALANEQGIETIPAYLTSELAEQVVTTHGPATVITANNVYAHTDDIATFTTAVKKLLAPDGIFVIEVQYLGDLIAKNLFDIVYHEHVNYYHLTPLVSYFPTQGLEVFDVERPSVHGGSLRVFVQHQGGPHHRAAAVSELIATEEAHGLNQLATYHAFAERIAANKQRLAALIAQLKRQGKRIVGYGAPAKATTLMYTFGLTSAHLDYIIDDSPLKQGYVMPGTHVPIVPPAHLYQNTPDYCLILAWNFAEPIMQTHAAFRQQGGQFIIPIPEPKIV